MPESLVIVGAGGFGREVVELVAAVNMSGAEPRWDLQGVLDDDPSDLNLTRLDALGTPYLGQVDAWLHSGRTAQFVVGIGSPAARRSIADRMEARGMNAAILIHPDATVGRQVVLGHGTIICAGARITTTVTTGRHVHVDTNVTIGHDTSLGDFVRLNPGSSVSGDCTVENGVLVGVAAAILNGVRVGAGAVVGGSACVVHDVPSGAVVMGVPAKQSERRGSS